MKSHPLMKRLDNHVQLGQWLDANRERDRQNRTFQLSTLAMYTDDAIRFEKFPSHGVLGFSESSHDSNAVFLAGEILHSRILYGC